MKFDQDLCLNLWYDPIGYFGKMNSTLGSVVPLAMFLLVDEDSRFPFCVLDICHLSFGYVTVGYYMERKMIWGNNLPKIYFSITTIISIKTTIMIITTIIITPSLHYHHFPMITSINLTPAYKSPFSPKHCYLHDEATGTCGYVQWSTPVQELINPLLFLILLKASNFIFHTFPLACKLQAPN